MNDILCFISISWETQGTRKDKNMEIRVLRYFLTVAKEGSFTGAAAFLNVTQPTLSRQIRELEAELGQQLLIRGSHSVSLTAEGMILRRRAEEIVDMVSKTKAEFDSMEQTVGGEIYIGSGETDGMRLIAKVIGNLREEYPGIRCHLYSGNAQDVTERLDKGLLDFGLLIQPTDLSKYHVINLPHKDVWGVIMPKNSPLARKKSITRQDLLSLPLILSRQTVQKTPAYNGFLNWFGSDFEKLNITATYNLLFNAVMLVEQGIGYALTLDKLINIRNGGSVCFRPLDPALESGLDIVWKKYQVFSPAAKAFLTAVQKEFADR